jgi:hypothetical protein
MFNTSQGICDMVLSKQRIYGLENDWFASLDPWETCASVSLFITTLSEAALYIAAGSGKSVLRFVVHLTISVRRF